MMDVAEKGKLLVDWAQKEMPVLKMIRENFVQNKSFAGLKIGACLHVTPETANLVLLLRDAGAKVFLTASNPLSTKDEIVDYLKNYEGIWVESKRGESTQEYYNNIRKVISNQPDLVIDDGGDLISTMCSENKTISSRVIGGCEETTTGIIRLNNLHKEGKLLFPVIAVNEAKTKHMFDNRYGTGQSTIDGILRATNIMIAGKICVVAGYGWCGKGVAQRLKGMGARVIVTEIDPIKALEAVMDGFEVKTMEEASTIGDIFITVTGNIDVITEKHFNLMKDGAILANAGHFNVEINVEYLEKNKVSKRKIRENLEEYIMPNGKHLYLIGEGRLTNLVAAEGHPASVMDMSFANQALSLEFLAKNKNKLKPGIYQVPIEIDRKVAFYKLLSMKIRIDDLNEKQQKYLESWNYGT
ncbi:MAG: adenosylhomocysteinase [Candidatus Calescibacterium sp.]|nr:adenosylhomocysteinase [Candidatus Calescibacterium sp.]MCX7972341.1 adenosylhomocysteinase [bacterium]MDW8195938.1 adenosylhomocysteinase [Candidatus Calescibacterium sp.]